MMLIRIICICFALMLSGSLGAAQTTLSAQARLDPYKSSIQDGLFGNTTVSLSLSQGVPFRIYTLDTPMRLVLEFSVLDFAELDTVNINDSKRITTLHAATLTNGWSQMVLNLAEPMAVDNVGMRVDDTSLAAELSVVLRTVSPDQFSASVGRPQDDMLQTLPSAGQSLTPADGDNRFVIVLDPGHGGIDPGAQEGEIKEADLMLSLARRLRDLLRRADLADVFMTRDDDIFVPLEQRISIAHSVQADVFISLHADKVTEGIAQGATVYTLDKMASDEASAKLAERHDRAEIITGIDLSGADDEVAGVLLDLARQDTQPRSELLADALVASLSDLGVVETRPHRRANFSVLKAADIPSVLIEAGFMSSKQDLKNLSSPDWQSDFAKAVVEGILQWYIEDQKRAKLRRQ